MITIATMGKFWPQAGYGASWPKDGGSNYSGYAEQMKKPVVIVDRVRTSNEKITVEVTSIQEV